MTASRERVDEWIRIPREAWHWPLTGEPEVSPTPVYPNLHDGGHCQGLPLGGFGAGGIGRDYRGAFGRWTLKAGALKHFSDPANMFSVRVSTADGDAHATVLYPGRLGSGRQLSSWAWTYNAEGCVYHALFPKAWYEYPAGAQLPVDLVCEQFSPILPNNYRESSFPVGVFAWTMRNPTEETLTVSLMLSFTNMVGWFDDFGRGRPSRRGGGTINRPLRRSLESCHGDMVGVLMERDAPATELREGHGQFCVAALAREDVDVSTWCAFDPAGGGDAIWEAFAQQGRLPDVADSPRCVASQSVAGAVCIRTTLAPGQVRTVPLVLTWDLPVIAFGSGREHWRRYTHFAGREGRHAADLAAAGLTHWREWSAAIDRWHAEVMASRQGPDWYYTMLFNEAYLLVDGLTVWTDGTREAPGADPFFAVIECPDYPYYCTLDLWVYGSFVLLAHWPELEKNVIRRFARLIPHADDHRRRNPHNGTLFPSKERGAAPHDFGQPEEDPALVCNSYIHQNSNRWKDLNCQFVLNVYRDVVALDDAALLAECWPAVRLAVERLGAFDADGDGLIENDGSPDQTMDNIPMQGASAYCGGLWLAALHAAVDLARRVGDDDFAAAWTAVADRAVTAFDEKLWNGSHYRFDCDGAWPDALFIDALFGIWYGRLCGLRNLVDEDHYRASLTATLEANVRAFHKGAFGGANITGWGAANEGEESSFRTRDCQISEVLSGLNISFACQLAEAGCRGAAIEVLEAVYRVVYERFGLWFRTPAAWTVDGRFRAILNLRPLVVWALEWNQGLLQARRITVPDD